MTDMDSKGETTTAKACQPWWFSCEFTFIFTQSLI